MITINDVDLETRTKLTVKPKNAYFTTFEFPKRLVFVCV